MTALTLQLTKPTSLSDDEYYEFCQANPDLRIERNANGERVLMSPTGGETGRRNASLVAQLWIWNDPAGLGETFDSSGGFHLPNGADRAPDASCVTSEIWADLTPEQKEKFPPICPDFVVELCSFRDRLRPLQVKMSEYIDNGARLGWLINRKDKQVEIYRPGRVAEVLSNPSTLSGEPFLEGFTLNLKGIL